jgi:hypothetical protein
MIKTPSTVIETIGQLQQYLQVAIQLEHATLPLYLTAAYSAKIEANKPSIDIIRTVAKEEMLHLTLAANLLNAIGGQPDLISPGFVPPFPAHLPTGQDDFEVSIEKFSAHSLQIFLDIERPTELKPEHGKFVQHIQKTVNISKQHIDKAVLKNQNPLIPLTQVGDDQYALHYDIALIPHNHLSGNRKAISTAGLSLVPHVSARTTSDEHIELHYWSIGEFYKAIHLGFVELTEQMGKDALFTGKPEKQIDLKYFYSAGGESIVVTDLQSALAAIDLIAGQGEGSNQRVYDSEGELAHYYRFDQIQKRRYYRDPNKEGAGDAAGYPQGEIFSVDMDAVFPLKTNAKIADYNGHPELQEYALLFNGQYKRFLEILNTAFNGQPELCGVVLAEEMFRLKAAMEKLMRNPIPGTKYNAAPTFEMEHFIAPPSAPISISAADSVTSTPVLNHV